MTAKYGIAEWYGHDFSSLKPDMIRKYANQPPVPCPFRYPQGKCNKAGGVCSLRLYKDEPGGAHPLDQNIVTTCPNRFVEKGRMFSEVSKRLLGTDTPFVTTEIPFLMAERGEEHSKSVGMLDMVLVDSNSSPLHWCAVEIQAVYFSGKSMSKEITSYKKWYGSGTPFPSETRRPDFRSSGPKRLMPQLQIKVPTISRWGKKTAVVIDRSFWDSLSQMPKVRHISNCDIAWFIMDYTRSHGRYTIDVVDVVFTTLQDAVTGLTGGVPTSLETFEEKLRTKMNQSGFSVQPG